jgi:hypothetical protein
MLAALVGIGRIGHPDVRACDLVDEGLWIDLDVLSLFFIAFVFLVRFVIVNGFT